MTRPHLVNAADCPAHGWDGYRWKSLISGDHGPTTGITQGIAELVPGPPDERLLHCHAHCETYYVLSGQGELWVGDERHALAPGVAAFIPGGAHHLTFATGHEPLRILYTFAADSFAEVQYEFPGLSTSEGE